MTLQQNETVSLALNIEGDKARNDLGLLQKESKVLEKALSEVPNGSKECPDLNKLINANTTS